MPNRNGLRKWSYSNQVLLNENQVASETMGVSESIPKIRLLPCRIGVRLARDASHGNRRRRTALTKTHTAAFIRVPGMTPWNMTRQGREKYGLLKSGSRAELDPSQEFSKSRKIPQKAVVRRCC